MLSSAALLETPNSQVWHHLTHSAERYVREVLDTPLTLRPYDGPPGLPYFLRDRYRFLEVSGMSAPRFAFISNLR
jgi:hypothetical protein